MKTEARLARFRQTRPMRAGRLQQHKGAHEVGFDKGARAVYRAIDMGFGCEVHDHVGIHLFYHGFDGRRIADIGLGETVTTISRHAVQRCERTGVGELVQNMNSVIGLVQQMPNHRRTYESRSARNDDSHFAIPTYQTSMSDKGTPS